MSINNDVDVVRERTAQDTEETAPLLQVKQQAKTQKWNCAEWLADLKSTVWDRKQMCFCHKEEFMCFI